MNNVKIDLKLKEKLRNSNGETASFRSTHFLRLGKYE